jgi:putative ABC transport system substrate-binding protein
MRRRELIAFLGAATAWPRIAHAQQSPARIGFLPLGSPSNRYDLSYVEAFRGGLTDSGLIEGRNITVDMVWVTNEPEYDQAVIELMRRGARVLVPAGSSATRTSIGAPVLTSRESSKVKNQLTFQFRTRSSSSW